MARTFVTDRLKKMVAEMATKTMYGGRKMSASLMDKLTVEERDNGAGILAPYWFSVVEHGRGKRKRDVDMGFWKILYSWMEKNNIFKSASPKGKINEAKSMAWYINKYGNKQFRDGVFTDIYTAARESAIADIKAEYADQILSITKLTITKDIR